jgi:anti-sigma factor ChrR (cupin superfamily)
MNLNTDLSLRVAIDTDSVAWVHSPAPGVMRKMLHREGGEVANATSLVRYAARARFEPHRHELGEEFLVLEGEFADEFGRYPAGTYVRNPAGSFHAPYTDTGCTIFVKLRHLSTQDRERRVVDPSTASWVAGPGPGLELLPLASYGPERTALMRWTAGAAYPAHAHAGGEEIFVVDGAFQDENGVYRAGAWLRLPHGSGHAPASPQGCTLFMKTGHMAPVADAKGDAVAA